MYPFRDSTAMKKDGPFVGVGITLRVYIMRIMPQVVMLESSIKSNKDY